MLTSGTVPLKLYFNGATFHSKMAATAEGERAATDKGYKFIRVEGYLYPTQQPGTVPIKALLQ